MHHVVIYFKKDGVLHHISLCIISDNLEHDTCFVHELQRSVMFYFPENLPQTKSVDYFHDGCAGQFKKYKTKVRFWHWWNMGHGKSPCDRISVIVKHKILRASLQKHVNNQILTFRAAKGYCKSSIEGITFLIINMEDMVAVRENLKLWYELGDTRSCHHFTPISQYIIEGKQLSIDTNVFITHSFLDMPAPQNKTLWVT